MELHTVCIKGISTLFKNHLHADAFVYLVIHFNKATVSFVRCQ